ncbi:MAG TPA: hypothetical protein VJV39_21885 [Dongiaceae bacterium]|nr:hypothetical protein [Dongiaceae bacterium]
MPFGVAAAAVTAGAGLIGSAMQSSAAGKAAAAAEAQWRQAREDLEPWRNTGANALTVASNIAGANGPEAAQTAMGDFYTSPGYQWRLDEGMRAVDASAAARGMLRSGATLKAEQAHAQGLASGEFENYYNRLYNLSGQGLTAAQAGAGVSNNAAQGALTAGNTQASIYGNAASGIGAVANNYAQNRLMDDYINRPTASSGPANFSGSIGSPYTPSIYGVPSPY